MSLTQNQRLGTRRGVVRTGVGQVGVGMGNRHAVAGLFCRRQHGVQLGQARIAVQHEVCGGFRGFRHVLLNLRHAPLRGHVEIARIFMQAAVEQRKKRGFASAVSADKAYFLAGIDGDGGAVEQHACATAQGDVTKSDHGARDYPSDWTTASLAGIP